MTKIQFYVLSAVAAFLIFCLFGHYFMVLNNSKLAAAVNKDNATINNSKQLETILNRLAGRIAASADTDQPLKELLLRHGLQVSTAPAAAKPAKTPNP